MELTSTAFSQGEIIPDTYTCKGKNISPEMAWKGTPGETKSFTLIVEDPDAPGGTYTHWIAYNINAKRNALPSNLPGNSRVDGMMQGINDFGKVGYGGPCPPQAHGPHRYYFKIFALDTILDLPPGADKIDLGKAMNGHILAETELMGLYEIK